jgi:hypothetical protein
MSFPASLINWTPWIDGASVVAVAYGVAKAFEWFDGLISDESRVALWMYMADVPSDERIDAWGQVFPQLIDRVFGSKALSWKFFYRSCLASLLAVLIVAFIFSRTGIFSNLGEFALIKDGYSTPLKFNLTLLLTSSFTTALVTNCIPDYFSLIITRMFIQYIAKNATAFRTMIILVVDAVLSVVLMLPIVETYVLLLNIHADVREAEYGIFYDNVISMLTLHDLFGIFIYAALFTSAWLWIYVLSIFSIKITHNVRFVWVRIMPYLDIEKKPMQAIGRIAGIMAGVGYAVILGIVWLVHRGH